MTFSNNKATGSAAVFAIVVVLILGSVAVYTAVFGAILDSNETQAEPENTLSPVSATQTVGHIDTQTMSPKPTPAHTSTVTPMQTPTLTPTLSPTPASTATGTETPTPGPYANEKYSDFVAAVYGEAEVDADVPLKIRGHSVVEGNVLIISMDLTARSDDNIRRVRQVNTLVTSGFAQAIIHYDNGKIGGKVPDRLRIAEVNNTDSPPKTLHVNTSLARDYYLNNLNAPEFTDRYWDTARNMTNKEQEYIREMDNEGGNITLYNKTSE